MKSVLGISFNIVYYSVVCAPFLFLNQICHQFFYDYNISSNDIADNP